MPADPVGQSPSVEPEGAVGRDQSQPTSCCTQRSSFSFWISSQSSVESAWVPGEGTGIAQSVGGWQLGLFNKNDSVFSKVEEPCWLLMKSALHRTVKHTYVCKDKASMYTTHRPKQCRNPNPHTHTQASFPVALCPRDLTITHLKRRLSLHF